MERQRLRRREMGEGGCKGTAQRERRPGERRFQGRGAAGAGAGRAWARGSAHLRSHWWPRSKPRAACPPLPQPLSCGWSAFPWARSAPCRPWPWRFGLQRAPKPRALSPATLGRPLVHSLCTRETGPVRGQEGTSVGRCLC